MIKLLRASAGSGKTYRLAHKYISLLLSSPDPHAYRHVLAVTFTNKATDEMKRRILKELDILARSPKDSPYYEDFMADLEFESADDLARKADEVLKNILHDYGAFAVSTIDKFFQLTLRSFAREIGQFTSYQVELDRDSLVRESVDRILDSISDDDRQNFTLLNWLTNNAMERLREDGKFSLEGGLYEMASWLKKDQYRELCEKYGLSAKGMYSSQRLEEIKRLCARCIEDFRGKVEDAVKAIEEAFPLCGISPGDTKWNFAAGLISKYRKPKRGAVIEKPKASQLSKCLNVKTMFNKDVLKRLNESYLASYLAPPFEAFANLFGHEFRIYCTASIIRRQIGDLGIAERLFSEFETLMNEKNVLSIDDTNLILKKIIGGSDAPFVYEKLGVRFEDFLLDEFQDTSSIQWQNFEPLLRESVSRGGDNFIVGDIKQSIYRWRGSDWKLLESGVKGNFADSVDDGERLQENWRSTKEVVEFNNAFFTFAAKELDKQLEDSEGESIEKQLYADVVQIPMTREKQAGSVELSWLRGENTQEEDKDGEEDPVPYGVYNSILKAQAVGATLGQIAVLVRRNKDGSALASYLSGKGIPVISDDLLSVKSSVTVRRLTSLLSHFEGSGSDPVNEYIAKRIREEISGSPAEQGAYLSLTDLCESLLRDLRKYCPDVYDRETLHIQSYMDEVLEWSSIHGNDLSLFLKHWEETEKSISSPADIDAVRVITVHKAKGLEFPYVIFPYLEGIEFYEAARTDRWCHLPDNEKFGEASTVLWKVKLSDKSKDTLFCEEYKSERRLQFVDNLNVLYVAFTRASKALHVISWDKGGKLCSGKSEPAAKSSGEISNFSQLLYSFISSGMYYSFDTPGHAFFGEKYNFTTTDKAKSDAPIIVESRYESYSLNPEQNPGQDSGKDDEKIDMQERCRLKFNTTALDFFDEEGHTGFGASNRIRGTVLHNILSQVLVPDDLSNAVHYAVLDGSLPAGQAAWVESFLRKSIESVRSKGWFPDDRSKVRNEISIISPDGSVKRPDRVVFTPQGVVVIDYKFGQKRSYYERQVSEYASLCRQLYRQPVQSFLWYLDPTAATGE